MGYRFTAELWLHAGEAAWYFVTLPIDVADEIDDMTVGATRGFGSVRVRVTVGSTTWATSIFPSKQAESFLLPVKKAVRTAERIDEGDQVEIDLELVDLDGPMPS